MITDLRMVKRDGVTVLQMQRGDGWEDVKVEAEVKRNRMERLEDALRRSWDYARGNVNQPPDSLRLEVEALLKGVPDRRK